MTPKKASVAKHLSHAKRDIAAGTASFRSAANHIAAAIAAGATQAEAAAKVNRSQPWVSRLLKWKAGGFKGLPFDHPEADQEQDRCRSFQWANNITQGNNPRMVPTDVAYDVRPVAPYTSASVPESKVAHLNITHEQKAPVDVSEEVAAAIPLAVKLARLEQAVAELTTEIELRGGIVGAGRDVEYRIMAVVNALRSLAEHPPQRQRFLDDYRDTTLASFGRSIITNVS